MPWQQRFRVWRAWVHQRTGAWGAMLDRQEILLAALSAQQTGAVRVQVYEHLHVPDGLVHPGDRDAWLVQTLRQLGAHLPWRHRTMVLALAENRCRLGGFDWVDPGSARGLPGVVQREAATAWGVPLDAVSFDFQMAGADPAGVGDAPVQVQWAACLREELAQWRQHARSSGWRLPAVEPEHQAAQRAAMCLRGDVLQHWAQSPRDWQFSRTPVRSLDEVDWSRLQGSVLWKPLVACGAALGGLQ